MIYQQMPLIDSIWYSPIMAFPSLNSHHKLLAWRCSDLISLANTAQEEKYQTLMWGVNSKEWLPCGKVALGYAALQEACKKKFLIKRAPKEGLSKAELWKHVNHGNI